MKLFDFSEYKYVAKDEDGKVFLYSEKPILHGKDPWAWDSSGSSDQIDVLFLSEEYLKLPWKESLREIFSDGTLTEVSPYEHDEVILVSDNEIHWLPRYFKELSPKGVICYQEGKSSLTVSTRVQCRAWRYHKKDNR